MSSQIDLSNCDREPIHIPGSIQPHGVLMTLEEPALVVMQASESAQVHLGRRAVGLPLHELIDAESAEQVRAAFARPRPSDANPIPVSAGGSRFDGIAHRHDGVAILELESQRSLVETSIVTLRPVLVDLQSAHTVDDLCNAVVNAVRRLTGFERVMLYRFDEDGHGSVDAESRIDELEPYLGQHYPASDIPQQARALYLRTWLRLIPDARYTPSPILPALRPDTHQPLDLSFSGLRSVSPIHLEYLANMSVRASMSISLVVRNRLWGLISCLNHSEPWFLSYEVRSACEAVGRLVSLQIEALYQRDLAELRRGRHTTSDALADAMLQAREDEDVLDGLMSRPDELLALVNAGGVAIFGTDSHQTAGRTPSDRFLLELAAWLDDREAPFATHSLASRFAPGASEAGVASGVLSVELPGVPRRRIIWFRPEMVQTLIWGGDPNKAAELDPNTRLHPRRSFEKWKEVVHLRSRPWTPSDLEAAEELRRRAVEIDLARQLVRSQAAVRIRDDLVAVVSHDLRNPLNVIQMQAALMLQSTVAHEDEPSRRLRATAERIQRAVDRMNSLITDLLDLAKIEAGRFELQPRHTPITDLVREALGILRPLAEAKHIQIVDDICATGVANVDRDRMFQVFSNLVGNAIKFTPDGGIITVVTHEVGSELRISIADTGVGIADDAMHHVFDRYWQEPRSRRDGSGLGLFIAKGIVEAHGGHIWVERDPSGGAKFTFTIPRGAASEAMHGSPPGG